MMSKSCSLWVSLLLLSGCCDQTYQTKGSTPPPPSSSAKAAARQLEAPELPTEPFSFTPDFANGDPVRFCASNGDYIVKSKGFSDEKTGNGKKCFKIDLVFGNASYVYWEIPMPKHIPAECGKLKFSGKVFLGDESTNSRIIIAPSYEYPPSTVNGTCPNMYSTTTKGQWLGMGGDLVGIAATYEGFAADWGGVNFSNVGRRLLSMQLRLYGGKGDRAVVYLDGFKVEGEIPLEARYQEEVARRWAPVKERIDKKLGSWERSLDQDIKDAEGITAKTETTRRLKRDFLAQLSTLKGKVESMKRCGNINRNDDFDNAVERVDIQGNLAPMLAAYDSGDVNMLTSIVSPMSSDPVLPQGFYGIVGNGLEVTAAQGEYESASFVVHAVHDIKGLAVKVEDLRRGGQAITSSNIDIKAVKCWYQAGTAWHDITQDKTKKVLVPELLLNDDTLVKVDYVRKDDYLKLGFPDGNKYVWISDPNEDSAMVRKSRSIEDFPVKDSPSLLPLDVPANSNKQFWITIKIPENAVAGTYVGGIELLSADGDAQRLELKLNVLPFKLPEPYYDFLVWYRGALDAKGIGSISSELKSGAQFEAECNDMVAHGVRNTTVYQKLGSSTESRKAFAKYLAIRSACGMLNDPLYSLGTYTGSGIASIKGFLEFAKDNHINQVYFFGEDEQRGEKLLAQRDIWIKTRDMGAKVFATGFRDEQQHFKKMGDIQDLFVCSGYPYKEEAELWHSAQHKIWCYGNPQAGVENPEVYRRNFGLLLWRNGYDGACTYAYQHGFGNAWNDFDDTVYRDHCFTYPTVDGVVGTIAWEGYREARDDVRYVTKLQQLIDASMASGDERRKRAALLATRCLEAIDVEDDNLDAVRGKIINHILELLPGQ